MEQNSGTLSHPAKDTGDSLLLAGVATFQRALTTPRNPQESIEDIIPNPALTSEALRLLQDAAEKYSQQQQSGNEARAYLHMAKVYCQMKGSVETLSKAEEWNRKALELFDAVHDSQDCLHGYLQLATTLQERALAQQHTKEDDLDTALAALQTAEFLLLQQTDTALTALFKRTLAMVLGERFRGNRDENLMDAIATAEQALTFFREQPTHYPLEYGSLLNQVGNCYLKVSGNRKLWLERARAAFHEGVSTVDSQLYPRLHRVLAGNLSMTEAVIAAGEEVLPEKEMVARYNAEVHSYLRANNFPKATEWALAFLQWTWSLPSTPNVHTGAAHVMLSQLFRQQSALDVAEAHGYNALVVLYGVLSAGHPWFSLLGEAQQNFKEVLEQRNRSAAMLAPALQQAQQALSLAHAACQRGSQVIGTDPAAALPEFEQALLFFPCFPAALFYRGTVRMQQGDFGSALADFNAALSLKTRDIPSLVNRMNIWLRLKEYERAQTDCNTVLEIDATNDSALYARAQLSARKEQWQQAITDLDTLITAHPQELQAYLLRAEYHRQQKNFGKAIQDLELVLSNVSDEQTRQELEQRLSALRQVQEEQTGV